MPGVINGTLRAELFRGYQSVSQSLSSAEIEETAPQGMQFLVLRVQLEYQVGDYDQGEAYLERLLNALGPDYAWMDRLWTILALPW